MTDDQEQKWDGMTLESLEAELRCLGNIKIPKSLKAKLFKEIPLNRTTGMQAHRVLWWPKVCSFGLAVAAVLILALILLPDYEPSVPSQSAIADINDRPIRRSLVDQNNTVADTNYISYNGPRLNILSRE